MNLQGLALYATLGYLLQAVDMPWDSWQFWSFLGLFIASNWATRIHTVDELSEPIREAVQKLEAERRRLLSTEDTQQ